MLIVNSDYLNLSPPFLMHVALLLQIYGRRFFFVRSSALLKSYWNWRFTFFICLKSDYSNFKAVNCFSPSHTQTHKFRFQLMDTFFHCLSSFLGFYSQSNPHSVDIFLILRNTSFHNRFYIWTVTSLKSTTGQQGHNSFFLSRLFLLLYI